MRNLKPTSKESFDFHKKVIEKKSIKSGDLTYKNRLTSLNSKIESLYQLYQENFNKNSLEKLIAYNYTGKDKEDLISLYRYNAKFFQDLKVEVTTTADKRAILTCQNCTIGAVTSFDHVLPKDEFCEFVVNPLNLFPSCTNCNSIKSKNWFINGKRIYLNLYLDILPKVQYLFVDVKFEDLSFKTEFRIENKFSIDPDFFEIIYSHYDRLKLCKQFSDHCDKVITPLINDFRAYSKKLPFDEIVATTIEKEELNRNFFGYNYWYSILTLEIIKNADFKTYVQDYNREF